MMSFLNTWQFNLIAYLFSIVLFFQFYKLAARNSENDTLTTIVLQFTAGITALLFSLFTSFKLPTQAIFYYMLLCACIFYAINNILQTKAIKHLPISHYTIINQLNTVFLIIYGVTIFREPFVYTKIFGAVLIIIGNILVLYERGLAIRNKFVFYAIAATFIFSIALSIDINISSQFNLASYILITFTLPAFMLLTINKFPVSKMRQVLSNKNKYRKFLVLTGVFWFLTPFFGIKAIQLGTVTTVVPLQAISVLLNVLAAYIFQGERNNKYRAVIASLLVIAGIYFTVSA